MQYNEKKKKEPKDWRDARRLQAWELKQKGWKQKNITQALGVSKGTVSQWFKKRIARAWRLCESARGEAPNPA